MTCSIIMSVYNGGNVLKKSIESLLIQSDADFKIYIIDDNSNDDSLDFLKSIIDKRITILYNQINKGLFSNLNTLINKVGEDLIVLWSQDDIMYKDCIAETKLFHQKYLEIAFSYSDRDHIDENGNYSLKYNNWDITPEFITPELHLKIAWYTGSIAGNISCVTYKKWVFDQYGFFNDKLKFAADFEFQMRVGIVHPIGKIRKTLFALRSHNGQLSMKKGFVINQLKDDILVFSFMKKHTPSSLKKFAKDCINWRRSFYYLAVLKNELLSLRILNAFHYFLQFNRVQFIGLVLIRYSLKKMGLVKDISLW